MRKLTVFLVLAALVISTSAFAAEAPYSGEWTKVYDFEDGLQGWQLARDSGSINGGWIAPEERPKLPSAPGFTHYGAYGGNLHLTDGDAAKINVSDMLPGQTSVNSFVMQVDIYIPNLYSLVGSFPGSLPGNFCQRAGISAYRASDNQVMNLVARIDSDGRMWFKDRTWDNTDRYTDNADDGGTIGNNWGWVDDDASKPIEEWWNDWITLQIDYNYSTPGMVAAWVYKPWNTPQSGWAAGWAKVCEVEVHPTPVEWGWFSIGDVLVRANDTSWTQSQFDNVKFAFQPVPEPSSMLALASGLFGMAGFAIRRRK